MFVIFRKTFSPPLGFLYDLGCHSLQVRVSWLLLFGTAFASKHPTYQLFALVYSSRPLHKCTRIHVFFCPVALGQTPALAAKRRTILRMGERYSEGAVS
jgi:hypothetical protein